MAANATDSVIMRIASIILITFLILGCGRTNPVSEKPADKIIATVNGEPIYNKDIKLALALRFKDDPSLKITPNTLKEQLNLTIDERLALQHRKRSDSKIEILDQNLETK